MQTTKTEETPKDTAYDYSMENQKNFLEVTPEYNPLLNENAAEKSYHKLNIDPADIPNDIPEFHVSTAKVGVENIGENSHPEQTAENPNPAESVENTSFNPQINELGKKDKHTAASVAADTAIGAYAFIWSDLLTPMAQFNVKKLNKQIAEGTISGNIKIPIDEDTDVTLKKFTTDFNADVAEALQVTDDFKNEIREPLIRIMEKQGIGMTDEQKVGYEVVKDVAVKTAMVFQIKASIKEITEDFVERTKMMKQSSHPEAKQPDATPTANAKSPTQSEPDFVVHQKTATKDPVIVPAGNEDQIHSTNESKIQEMLKTSPKEKEMMPTFNQPQNIINPGSNVDILNDMEKAAKSGKVVKGASPKKATVATAKKPAIQKPKS